MSDTASLKLDTLPLATKRGLIEIANLNIFPNTNWYLAGGTALALQVGHRESFDLDFFTPDKIDNLVPLERELIVTGKWTSTLAQKGTLYGVFYGAKVSFISYPFFVPTKKRVMCGNIPIIVPADIAVMKVIATSQRGRKRDFIDLFWLCHNGENLRDIILRVKKQYPGEKHNIPHFIKSLNYFVDAEDEAMPRLCFEATWSEIKKFFQAQAADLGRNLQELM